MIDKLRSRFDETVVYKDLKKAAFFSSVNLPSFLRDWLLKKTTDDDGNIDFEAITNFVREHLPDQNGWEELKERVITEMDRVRILAKIVADVDVRTSEVTFSLPDYGLKNKETFVEPTCWQTIREELPCGREIWGMLELGYRPPIKEMKIEGRIILTQFKNFCPMQGDLDYYKDARAGFTFDEWLDVLLGAIDYNAVGYRDEEEKLTMLTRLLPFVEKRLNLIELAPKGTGKSYLYGRVSRYGWLSNGGSMTRAKMFYDISKQTEGLVGGHDFVVFDEVQSISFSDPDEMRTALQGYLESGVFTVGNYEGKADAGLVLCGNISKDLQDQNGFGNMFRELPEVFHASALIDRFHGFIKGWNIPRMNDDLKIAGWALNSEYFTTILHELRGDVSYRLIVDELVVVPPAADTRDTEAVKRVTTAYLKLLFPNVREASDVDIRLFKRHCLDRAVAMRDVIRYQLGLLDAEYKGKDVPDFNVRGW